MKLPTSVNLDTSFKQDVYQGLTSYPKFLYSKYIYDEQGDKLFQRIMELPEYYLTNSEFEILQEQTDAIIDSFCQGEQGFDLIELGAGDGKKTRLLLERMLQREVDFVYKPIDISSHAIASLSEALNKEFPGLSLEPEVGAYFEVLGRLQSVSTRKKVILFLGSNIGNLLHPRAVSFLSQLKDNMNPPDRVFIGFDQKKNPQTILDAYNDPQGVTAAFNKNLLYRINKEMDADFEPDGFKHWETYDPETGTAKSYLVTLRPMKVNIAALDLEIEFAAWETIHTEISQKYTNEVVNWLAQQAGLQVDAQFTDKKNYYKNYCFKTK